jgi:hypothetical protein
MAIHNENQWNLELVAQTLVRRTLSGALEGEKVTLWKPARRETMGLCA